MFPLPNEFYSEPSQPPFLAGRNLLFVNGQSAIRALVERLAPANVWLPSYLCGSLLEASRLDGSRVRFYALSYDLAMPSLEWIDDVRPGDLVVFIDFFGFLCDRATIDRARTQGAWVLEDACQALLTEDAATRADFVVFSPRKFVGVPDGGVLKLNSAVSLDGICDQEPPIDWWLVAIQASVLRGEFDRHGGTRRWFELFQESEDRAPMGHYAMSEFSRSLLNHCFDYEQISERRRSNFSALAEPLRRLALFPDLPAGVVPLGFPVRVSERRRLRQALFEQDIYPATHWPIEGLVPSEFAASHRLAQDILTLPCDQRYDRVDMERMAERVLETTAS